MLDKTTPCYVSRRGNCSLRIPHWIPHFVYNKLLYIIVLLHMFGHHHEGLLSQWNKMNWAGQHGKRTRLTNNKIHQDDGTTRDPPAWTFYYHHPLPLWLQIQLRCKRLMKCDELQSGDRERTNKLNLNNNNDNNNYVGTLIYTNVCACKPWGWKVYHM